MKTLFTFSFVLFVTGVFAQDMNSGEPCRAFFKFEVNNKLMMPYAATAIDFYDHSVGKVKEWYWDFGEGNASKEQNPMFIFRHPVPAPNIRINPYRTVTLTITTENCKSSYSLVINIMNGTVYMKSECPYVMRVKSGFPIQLSSCAGWANAQVYLKDSVIKTTGYLWSTGAAGQDVKNLCATSTYSVKATTTDGCEVACTFVLHSDGTIKEIPVTWWVNGPRDNQYIIYHLNDKNLTVIWKKPDGTVIASDSIPLNPLYGGSEILDMEVRDSSGMVVYNEKIALKAPVTGSVGTEEPHPEVLLFPNPVADILSIVYSGRPMEDLRVSIADLSGRIIATKAFSRITTGEVLKMDVSAVKNGVYVCRIVLSNEEVIFRKFAK